MQEDIHWSRKLLPFILGLMSIMVISYVVFGAYTGGFELRDGVRVMPIPIYMRW